MDISQAEDGIRDNNRSRGLGDVYKRQVPTPTVPPRYHPTITTEISKHARTKAIGKFVIFVKPVINPSLGPGPRFATK